MPRYTPLAKGLEQVKRAHFEEALPFLEDVLYPTPRLRGSELKTARFALVQALFFTGKTRAAEREVRALLRIAPAFKLNSSQHAPELIEFFEAIRRRVDSRPVRREPATGDTQAVDMPPAASQPAIETPASAEATDVVPLSASAPVQLAAPLAPAPRRQAPWYLKVLPFGVGQFANGDPKIGALFLSLGASFLAANIALYAVNLQRRQPDGGFPRETLSVALYWMQQASGVALYSILIAGVLDAFLGSPQRMASAPE